MPEFEINTTINKPLDLVWDAFINPNNMIVWTRYLEKVEVVKGKFGEIGAIAQLHYYEKGRIYVMQEELIDYEFHKRIASKVTGNKMNITVENAFQRIQDGTRINMRWKGTNKSLFLKVVLRLMQKKIRNQAQLELDYFKELVEKHGAIFPKKSLERN